VTVECALHTRLTRALLNLTQREVLGSSLEMIDEPHLSDR
jgi:hypothetical protein